MCCRQTYLFAAYFCDRGCSRSREDLPSYRVMHDALLKEDKMEGLLAYKLKSDSPRLLIIIRALEDNRMPRDHKDVQPDISRFATKDYVWTKESVVSIQGT
jgi:hypothetical protein